MEVGEMKQVFNVMDQLAGDTEPSVRAELMEQVGHLCVCSNQITSTYDIACKPFCRCLI